MDLQKETGLLRWDFLRKQDVVSHVMQLQTIFNMKLTDF